jgi:hypothetical protein
LIMQHKNSGKAQWTLPPPKAVVFQGIIKLCD